MNKPILSTLLIVFFLFLLSWPSNSVPIRPSDNLNFATDLTPVIGRSDTAIKKQFGEPISTKASCSVPLKLHGKDKGVVSGDVLHYKHIIASKETKQVLGSIERSICILKRVAVGEQINIVSRKNTLYTSQTWVYLDPELAGRLLLEDQSLKEFFEKYLREKNGVELVF